MWVMLCYVKLLDNNIVGECRPYKLRLSCLLAGLEYNSPPAKGNFWNWFDLRSNKNSFISLTKTFSKDEIDFETHFPSNCVTVVSWCSKYFVFSPVGSFLKCSLEPRGFITTNRWREFFSLVLQGEKIWKEIY